MDEIDRLLSLVENPTRRRILESLVREPSYPLRLSKELGVSQQAVMKNLVLMEQNGLVSSSRADSDMGPSRIVYSPNSEFTLVVEMGCGRFVARMAGPRMAAEAMQEATRSQILDRIGEIDKEIGYLEKRRAALMQERDALTGALGGSKNAEDGDENNTQSMERRQGDDQ